MAIEKAVFLNTGINLPNAYHKIVEINFINLDTISVIYKVKVYADQQARVDNRVPVQEIEIRSMDVTIFGLDVMDEINSNIIRKCYEHLKMQSNVNGIDYTIGVIDLVE